jgi:uncharacterized membrane protein YphA (DoxX/SURF4 family)
MTTPSVPVAGVWLAALRIYTGIFWLMHGIRKLQAPDWAAPNGMMAHMVGEFTKGNSGWYHDLLVNNVLPNAALFAHLVAWGETLAGVSLLLGLLTPLGGLVGAFLVFNYFLAKGMGFAAFDGLDIETMVLNLACVFLGTGSVFSLDALFWRTNRTSRLAPL